MKTPRHNPWLAACALAAALLTTPLLAAAQPHPPPPPAPEALAERLEHMQALRTLKLAEVLNTDAKTLEAVDAQLRAWDLRLLQKGADLARTTHDLRRAVRRGDASEAEFERLTLAVLTLRKDLDALRYQQYEAAAKPLQPSLRARLLLFLPQFERKARKALADGPHGRRGKLHRRGAPPPLDPLDDDPEDDDE